MAEEGLKKTKNDLIHGIYFNQCFGGGTEYSHGEDNLFLTDCLRKGLKIYAYPEYIAKLTEERKSTWLIIQQRSSLYQVARLCVSSSRTGRM